MSVGLNSVSVQTVPDNTKAATDQDAMGRPLRSAHGLSKDTTFTRNLNCYGP